MECEFLVLLNFECHVCEELIEHYMDRLETFLEINQEVTK